MGLNLVGLMILLILVALAIAVLFRVSASKRPCPYCRTMMPKATIMCPHCRRAVPLAY